MYEINVYFSICYIDLPLNIDNNDQNKNDSDKDDDEKEAEQKAMEMATSGQASKLIKKVLETKKSPIVDVIKRMGHARNSWDLVALASGLHWISEEKGLLATLDHLSTSQISTVLIATHFLREKPHQLEALIWWFADFQDKYQKMNRNKKKKKNDASTVSKIDKTCLENDKPSHAQNYLTTTWTEISKQMKSIFHKSSGKINCDIFSFTKFKVDDYVTPEMKNWIQNQKKFEA